MHLVVYIEQSQFNIDVLFAYQIFIHTTPVSIMALSIQLQVFETGIKVTQGLLLCTIRMEHYIVYSLIT